MTTEIEKNLHAVKDRIANAAQRTGRSADEVRLILVSKTIAVENIKTAIHAGQLFLGENKVQEGLRKSTELKEESIKWAMIGHLQTNKVKDALSFADEVQSLDRLSLATALEKRLQFLGQSLDVFIQVNTSNETSKYGLHPDNVSGFLQELKAFDALRVRGFMTLATFTSNEIEVRRCFRVLREIRDRCVNEAHQGDSLQELSMGMSGDFEWAIEEGATTVRVGQAVFGARPYPPSYYWPDLANCPRKA